jgi:hypothetical protein
VGEVCRAGVGVLGGVCLSGEKGQRCERSRDGMIRDLYVGEASVLLSEVCH